MSDHGDDAAATPTARPDEPQGDQQLPLLHATTDGGSSDTGVRARALVLDAFAAARRAGKAEWAAMTVAVLKNRILDLTDRTFAESEYGARDMASFVRGMPDVLEVLPNPAGSGPAIVRLLDSGAIDRAVEAPPGPAGEAPSPRGRLTIRPDLWHAALDWHAAGRVVLDDGKVRLRKDGDTRDAVLPTFEPVPESHFEQWKREFVDEVSSEVQGVQAEALSAWAGRPAPAKDLGRALQDRWMDKLRAKVLEHLQVWYDTQGLEPPRDLLYVEPDTPRPTALATPLDATSPTAPSRRLKDFVLRCIHEMSEEELRALPIPAGVASRVRG